ncbi:hypothetical protein [Marinobacter subterrani]|uniref:hypothetical protein n=1 Tax=Marinobacter subterrani TaxID=1658765 RepID=UPI002355953A|nr:hypothetical protein [Marinobacter subterrani]
MRKMLAIYFTSLAGATLFWGFAVESVELAKQIFGAVILIGFGFFVTIGHKLLAEWLVDCWESTFGKDEPNDHF